jgi:hypothetical protein
MGDPWHPEIESVNLPVSPEASLMDAPFSLFHRLGAQKYSEAGDSLILNHIIY